MSDWKTKAMKTHKFNPETGLWDRKDWLKRASEDHVRHLAGLPVGDRNPNRTRAFARQLIG